MRSTSAPVMITQAARGIFGMSLIVIESDTAQPEGGIAYRLIAIAAPSDSAILYTCRSALKGSGGMRILLGEDDSELRDDIERVENTPSDEHLVTRSIVQRESTMRSEIWDAQVRANFSLNAEVSGLTHTTDNSESSSEELKEQSHHRRHENNAKLTVSITRTRSEIGREVSGIYVVQSAKSATIS